MRPARKKRKQGEPSRRSARRAAVSQFIEREARESASTSLPPGEEDDDDDDDDDDERDEQSQSSFIDDRTSQSQNSPVSHAALDNALRARPSTSRDVPPVIIGPYFPGGLARSPEEATAFNFALFLYDSLRLPYGLFDDDEHGEVQFENLQQCRQYCTRYVAEREEWCSQQQRAPDQTQQMRSELSKATMFHQAGHPLGVQMTTGNPLFDSHLEDLRLDIFGNVMFLKAPHWSDISAQFMHGFPRRLIVDHHRGLLPGNITVAARISNQAIRSLSTGDVAAFVSQRMVKGLGLTTPELMLARASAIKYAGTRDKPARLVDFMLRYGMDFLTITPLSQDKLEALRTTSTNHWSHVLASLPDEGEADLSSSSDESELAIEWDTGAEVETMPGRGREEHEVALTAHVDNLVRCYVQFETVQNLTERRPSGSSGMSRRRKQATPRRAALSRPSASQESSTPATGVQPQEPEEHQQQTPAPPPNPRELLLALPGIATTRIPKEDSLNRLEQFLRANQPCDPQPAEQATGEDTHTLAEARQAAALQHYQEVRNRKVRDRVPDVWAASKADCTCLGDPVAAPSQGDDDQNCPYCLCDDDGGDVASVTAKCRNDECSVCMMMNKLDKPTLAALGLKRNERLTAMLELAPFIARCLNSGEIPEERRCVLVQAFCDLLSCCKTKLRYLANVGFLVMICPRLRHLHLEKGWGDVWSNLSKVATAIGYHDDRRSQLAALIFMRRRCVRDSSSKWLWHLQSEDPEEQAIDREVFQQEQAGDSPTA